VGKGIIGRLYQEKLGCLGFCVLPKGLNIYLLLS